MFSPQDCQSNTVPQASRGGEALLCSRPFWASAQHPYSRIIVATFKHLLPTLSMGRAIMDVVKAQPTASLGVVSALIGEAIDAVDMIGAGIAMWRSTGATASVPFFQSYLAKAHAMLGQFDEAQHHIDQAMATIESTGERVRAAEVQRLAGEVAMLSPRADSPEFQCRCVECGRGGFSPASCT